MTKQPEGFLAEPVAAKSSRVSLLSLYESPIHKVAFVVVVVQADAQLKPEDQYSTNPTLIQTLPLI